MANADIVPLVNIQQRIYTVRGLRVMLDADLARFYGASTSNLNKAVSRNLSRFPEDFAFKLNPGEMADLMFQIGISSGGHGGVRKPPTVFTEQGGAMLASVLRTPKAALVSVAIVRAFVQLRELLAGNQKLAAKLAEWERKLGRHDEAIRDIFQAIRELLAQPRTRVKEVGFHTLLPKRVKKRST